jgi:hypothetical protein
MPRSGNHHDLGLFGVGERPPKPRGTIGLYHLAWQVDTIDDLEQARHQPQVPAWEEAGLCSRGSRS